MAMMSSNNKEHGALNAKCPVCGSDNTNGLGEQHGGDRYQMCDIECLMEFRENPDSYTKDG